MNTRLIGTKNEYYAERILVKNNFTLLYKNYYTRYGEIDLITIKGDKLYFFEVKYVSGNYSISCFSKINKVKINNLKKAIQIFKDFYGMSAYTSEIWALGFEGDSFKITKIS